MSRQTPQHKGFARPIVDTLEIALAVTQRYGVQLRSEDADDQRIFTTLGNLAAHIEARRAEAGGAS